MGPSRWVAASDGRYGSSDHRSRRRVTAPSTSTTAPPTRRGGETCRLRRRPPRRPRRPPPRRRPLDHDGNERPCHRPSQPGFRIVTASPLPNANVGTEYTAFIEACCGNGAGPIRWSLVAGRVPAGLRFVGDDFRLTQTTGVVGTQRAETTTFTVEACAHQAARRTFPSPSIRQLPLEITNGGNTWRLAPSESPYANSLFAFEGVRPDVVDHRHAPTRTPPSTATRSPARPTTAGDRTPSPARCARQTDSKPSALHHHHQPADLNGTTNRQSHTSPMERDTHAKGPCSAPRSSVRPGRCARRAGAGLRDRPGDARRRERRHRRRLVHHGDGVLELAEAAVVQGRRRPPPGRHEAVQPRGQHGADLRHPQTEARSRSRSRSRTKPAPPTPRPSRSPSSRRRRSSSPPRPCPTGPSASSTAAATCSPAVGSPATPGRWCPASFPRPGAAPRRENTISGTPTTAGTFTFTVQVTDEQGTTAEKTFTITIS